MKKAARRRPFSFRKADYWLAAIAGEAAPIGADAASDAAGAGAGVATVGAVAGAASSFLPQAARATAATRAAIRSDLFMFVLKVKSSIDYR